MHTLYMLRFSSGKSYVGQTIRSITRRMSQHRRSVALGSQLLVHCAWRKYGEPDLVLLDEVESQEQLHAAEEEAIKKFNTLSPNGYNVAYGGTTAPSKNPDVAAKISAKAKGRKVSDTSKISDGVKRNWQNAEYRKKVSDGLKASWTKEARENALNNSKICGRGEKKPATQFQNQLNKNCLLTLERQRPRQK